MANRDEAGGILQAGEHTDGGAERLMDGDAGTDAGRAETCAVCRWWLSGLCRRFPPTVTPESDLEYRCSEWPVTAADDWCGEFKPQPEAAR